MSPALSKSSLALCMLALPLTWLGTSAARRAPANETLEEAMGQMNRSLKALGKGITEDTRTQALEELVKFEQAVISAKGAVPDSAAEVDEKKRAEFTAEFRATLCEVLKVACDVEIAVTNGKYKDAEGLLKNKLSSLKSAGHDKFKKEEKEGGGKGR